MALVVAGEEKNTELQGFSPPSAAARAVRR